MKTKPIYKMGQIAVEDQIYVIHPDLEWITAKIRIKYLAYPPFSFCVKKNLQWWNLEKCVNTL